MITITDFLNLEGSNYTKKTLLEAIENFSSSRIERREFTFNVYSVTIYPSKNEVLITDDVSPEENPAVTVSLKDFYAAIKNFQTVE